MGTGAGGVGVALTPPKLFWREIKRTGFGHDFLQRLWCAELGVPGDDVGQEPLPRCGTRGAGRGSLGRIEYGEGGSGLGRDSVSPRPAGSAPPGPVPDGVLRVYSMRFCPFAQRTLLVLNAKGIR